MRLDQNQSENQTRFNTGRSVTHRIAQPTVSSSEADAGAGTLTGVAGTCTFMPHAEQRTILPLAWAGAHNSVRHLRLGQIKRMTEDAM